MLLEGWTVDLRGVRDDSTEGIRSDEGTQCCRTGGRTAREETKEGFKVKQALVRTSNEQSGRENLKLAPRATPHGLN